jgi:hypothetical protein
MSPEENKALFFRTKVAGRWAQLNFLHLLRHLGATHIPQG